MGSEVYSWRVSTELKSDLEREAALRKTSVSAVLTLAVREWLKKSAMSVEEDAQQQALHEAASKCLGAIAGRDPQRAENASRIVRERLRRRRAR
jgi:hypothetical protein